MLALGIDIGGTNIAFALINRQGDVLYRHQTATGATEAIVDQIIEGIYIVLAQGNQPLSGIGIGSPGHVDPSTGIVRNAVNLKWQEMPLGEKIRAAFDYPIYIEKDTNAATLGEHYYGVAKGEPNFIYVAIGTGLGGGAMVAGNLMSGATSYAMEVGHVALFPDGRQCACGLAGCPEMYISGIGLLASLHEYAPRFPHSALTIHSTTADILSVARKGDLLAQKILETAQNGLATMLSYTISLLNPALVVIGGGLGHAAPEYFITGIYPEVICRVLPATRQGFQILQSTLSDSAIGAACLVWHHHPVS